MLITNRWRRLAVIAGLAWILAVPAIQFFSAPQTFLLQSDAISHENGCAYTITIDHRPVAWPITRFDSDTLSSTTASLLTLQEEGKPTGQPHMLHDNIRTQGGGNYSHWNGLLYFSTADCSDPRTNGRTYEVTMAASLSPWVKYVWLITVYAFSFRLIAASRTGNRMSSDPVAMAAGLLFPLLVAGIVLTARGVADIGPYLAWAQYFSTFNLATFSGFPRSVTGVPLIQWSYGTGLLAAIPAVLVSSPKVIPAPLVAMMLGLVNAALVLYIARSVTGSRVQATLILAGLLLFTPAGFYLNKYSAEGWTVFLVLSGLALLERNKNSTVRHAASITFMLGVVMYFLILVKIQNIVLCAGLWLMFVSSGLVSPWTERRNRVFVIRHTLILAVVSGVGLAFLLLFNHVVSNDYFKSPYDVGDMAFSMFSPGNFKFTEVLFSPWHGLLIYHPVIAVLVYALLRELVTKRVSVKDAGFLVAVAGLVVMALQVLIQGSWFIWWMGTGTYGARGFAGASLLLAYACLRTGVLRFHSVSGPAYLMCLVLAALSAFLLGTGETNIVDFPGFLQLVEHESWPGIIAILAVLQWIQFTLKPDRSTLLACHLLALAAYPLIFNAITGDTNYLLIAFIVIVVLLCVRYLSVPYTGWQGGAVAQRMIVMSVMAAFVISVVLQVLLLNDFGREARENDQTGYALDCNEYVASYQEYQSISGYEQEKKALYDFLIRQNCI